MRAADYPEAIYYKNNARELISNYLWHPAYEFINILESADDLDLRVLTNKEGEVTYNERFKATFYSEMDFRKFPFDSQEFRIDMESFLYVSEELKFGELELHFNESEGINVFQKWS